MENELFTPGFQVADPQAIADEIKNGRGYCVFEQALRPDALEKLCEQLPEIECLVNNNHIGYVKAYGSNYLAHTLATSKQCYDIVTSESIRAICRHFFEKPFKICNQRIYQTHTASHLPWHTDNNLQSGNNYNGKHQIPGIMFMFYLSDVNETNPFQLIPYSQKWSQENVGRFFTDDYIAQNYSEEVISVRAPRGTLIMCSSRMAHRAEPFIKRDFKRLTLLFQVDEISEEHCGHGEKIIVNTSFVDNRNPEILDYLGFGVQCDYPPFPQTSAATMLPVDMIQLQKQILPKAAKGLMISLGKKVLPPSLVNNIRAKIYKKTEKSHA